MADPRYSMMEPMPPPVPMRLMIASTMSFAVTPTGKLAVDGDRHGARLRLRQRLRGEHVLDLAGADAERQRAERAVGRRVAVAAHDGHARLREPELGPDHVHDALARRAHRVEADAELGAVRRQHLHLLARDRIGDRQVDVLGRDVVVHRGHGEVGPAHGAPGQAQAVERLRRRDLVDEVEIDVEEVGLALVVVDDVVVPHLLAQRTGGRAGHGLILPGACFTARMASPDLRHGHREGPVGRRRRGARLGRRVPRRHRRERRAPRHLPRPARQPRRPPVGAHRLPAHARARSSCSAGRSATATAAARSS